MRPRAVVIHGSKPIVEAGLSSVRWYVGGAAILVSGLALAASAAAQTVQMKTAHLVEWDLPIAADVSPGAMVVDTRGEDNNRVWFVTRSGNPRAFRLSPQKSPMKGGAQWTSWDLATDSLFAGGVKKLRPSHDRRYLFVRTATSIQRIDTQNCDSTTCQRTEWDDQSTEFVSDLAVSDWNEVFTTAAVLDTTGVVDPAQSYLQMLTAGSQTSGSVTVKRWNVGGGAGFCQGASTSGPCVSGVATHPSNRYLVYYSEPGANNVAELNISTNQVRRWPVTAVGASEPRQLNVDRWGVVWVVTGSGHLVSLDPCANQMSGHPIPGGDLNDPFGVAPDDDVVGYTGSGTNKVGMLVPQKHSVYVTVGPSSTPITPSMPPVPVSSARAAFINGSTLPNPKVVTAFVTTQPDGTYVEAQLDAGDDDQSPLGITPAKWRGQGTFFYAVGLNPDAVNRVGFVRLPMPQKVKHPRDDDDNEDGWAHDKHAAGWHMNSDDDDDDDGFENEYDSPTAQENVQVGDPAALSAGQTKDYSMTASPTSLALIALAVAEDDPTAFLSVDIFNSLGQLVATSPVTPGLAAATVLLPVAGNYTARVHNQNPAAATHTPKLIVREPWPQ